MTTEMDQVIQNNNNYEVINLRKLTENTFILTISKGKIKFVAGQHINVSIKGEYQLYT